MPTLKIDNRTVSVPAGTKVIEAAERLGIVIPRFCYHPALGAVGACRVCAVAFKEGPVKGIQMSCMINAQDGMVVSTTDGEAVDFRRHVIEWLMLHHPHDCPVCDEGGHCLLQDLTVAGGHGMRRYQGLKRTHHNQVLGPLIQHEMNRCIQCYRCSRFYQEYTGYRDLGVMGIGSWVYFGRSAEGTLESPFAGNLVDLCPTGVYTDKPSRYIGRRWDFQRQPVVCIHCSLGCNLTALARYRQIVRHEARANDAVNGYFICDRGRYGYAYASLAGRPRQAMAAGVPGAASDILAGAREAIEHAVAQSGPASVAVAASTRSSLETLAMIRQTCHHCGWTGSAVVSTSRQAMNLRAAVGRLTPTLAISMAGVSAADNVLVIGADPLNEAPMLALALRQVQRRGGHVTVIDPRGVQLPLDFEHLAVHPVDIGATLVALTEKIGGGSRPWPVNVVHSDAVDEAFVATLAKRIKSSPRPVVVCGTDILMPADLSLAADVAEALLLTHHAVGLFYTLTGANAFAAALMHDPVVSAENILHRIEEGSVRTLVAVEADLWHTFPDRRRLQAAIERLDHLVVLDYVDSPLVGQAGHFIPTQPVYESSGHWINQEGRLQTTQKTMAGGEPIRITGGLDHPPRVFGSAIPGGEPMPAWQVVALLAGDTDAEPDKNRVLQTALSDFHPAVELPVSDSTGDRIDLDQVAAGAAPGSLEAGEGDERLTLLLVDRTFGTEPLSAMAPVLNELEETPTGRLHPETMARLGVAAGATVTVSIDGRRLTVAVAPDSRMAPEVLVVPRHHLLAWQAFGETRVMLESSQLKAEST
ncbi:MAG: NADH-quinone oxidoreductase subunit NuoG [Desulfosarcina sp.]